MASHQMLTDNVGCDLLVTSMKFGKQHHLLMIEKRIALLLRNVVLHLLAPKVSSI